MPALSRPRHEAFAQAIVMGMAGDGPMSQAAAYRAAGYKTTPKGAKASASRLLSFANHIGARVAELQQEAAKAKGVTLQSISNELDEAREVAKQNDQAAAMVSATATKARLYGLEIKRTEVGKPGDFSETNSTKDIARKALADIGMNDPTELEIEQTILELARHARALEAIASRNMVAAGN